MATILQFLGVLWLIGFVLFIGLMLLLHRDRRLERQEEESLAELWARNRYWDFEGEVEDDSAKLHEIEEGK